MLCLFALDRLDQVPMSVRQMEASAKPMKRRQGCGCLDKADRERLGAELGAGKAAVGVLAPVSEADAVKAKLTEVGGAAESHTVTDEDLEEANAADSSA